MADLLRDQNKNMNLEQLKQWSATKQKCKPLEKW